MRNREVLLLSLLLCIYVSNVQSESLSLIGSCLLSKEGNPAVFISARDSDGNSNVKVSFKAGNSSIDLATYEKLDGDVFKTISIPVANYPEYDSYELTLSHYNLVDEKTNQQTVKLFNPLRHPVILIQTDKPVYDVGDLINFRIFVLNQNFVPIYYNKMTVIIKDAKDKTIKEFNNSEQSTFGVYKNSLKISQSPKLGQWKIEVLVDGKKKSKNFNVQKNNGFQVDIKCNQHVAYSVGNMQMHLNIEKAQKKSFSGSANISVIASLASNNRVMFTKFLKSNNVVNGNNILPVDFVRDLGLSGLSNDYILKFTVEVIEDGTKLSSKVYAKVNLRKDSRLIEVKSSKYFRPTFPFPVEVHVKSFSGHLDQSYEDIQVTVEQLSNSNNVLKTVSIKKKVFNGKVDLKLSPTIDAKKIILKLKYKNTEVTETIKAIPSQDDEYLQITTESINKNVGDTVHFTVNSTAFGMPTLHVMVIGPNGMIFQKDYPQAEGKDLFEFPVKITENMVPTTNIIAYYFKEDSVVYDGYSLDVGTSVINTLRIDTVSNAEPNETIDIKILSENGTKVFIAAVSGNADANKDIKDLLENKSNTKLKFRDTSGYDFAQFGAFILEPLKNNKKPSNELEDMTSNADDTTTNMIFSNVWLFEDIDSEGRTILNKQVPELQATWQIYGFSMHPSKGLSLSTTTPIITVKLNLDVMIKVPKSIYKGEVVKINYQVFNYLSHPIEAKVKITIKNGKFLNLNSIKNCYDESEGTDHKIENKSIQTESSSTFNEYITGAENQPIEIIVEVSSGNYKAKKSKFINVIARSEPQTSVETIPNDDVLKSAMQYLDKTLSTPIKHDDHKVYKFAASIIKYDYYLGHESESSTNMIQTLQDSYFEIIPILKNLIKPQADSNLKLVAYIADSLLDARKFIIVDENLIRDALNFIKSKQTFDGSFPYDSDLDSRRAIGERTAQELLQTGLVILPFLKYNPTYSDYQNFVDKAIKKLRGEKFSNDYEKVIVANALMHIDKNTQLSSFNIQNNYKTAKFAKLNSMFIEIVSYLISLKDDPIDELKWLISEMKTNNGFYSPYDAILATKALHKASTIYKINLNDITPSSKVNQTLTEEFVLEVTKTESNGTLEISIDVTYKAPVSKNSKEVIKTNLVVIEAMLPSGYEYSLYKNNNVDKNVDVQNDGRLVLINIEKMENGRKQHHKILAEKKFTVFNAVKSTVKVYDYYRSNINKQVELEVDVNENKCNKTEIIDEPKSGSEGDPTTDYEN